MKVYLHVGMPKCASSTLQKYFKDNADLHARYGFCYPEAFREPAGYYSHRPLHDLHESKLGPAIDAIEQEANKKKCSTIFISSEEFVNSLWDKEIFPQLVNRLNVKFGSENVFILFLVRNHFLFVESVYAQFIRAGMFRVHADEFFKRGDGTVLEFLDYFKDVNGFDFFDYSSFIDIYREVAPQNKLEVISIESPDLQGGDILEYLCDRFHLPLPKKGAGEKVNARSGGKPLLAMHYAHKNYGAGMLSGKGHIFNEVFGSRESGNSKVFQLTGTAYKRVLEASAKDSRYFKSNFSSYPESVFSIPLGFPRNVENEMRLTNDEMCAARYIVEAESPRVELASKIADEAIPYPMELIQWHEKRLDKISKRLLTLEQEKHGETVSCKRSESVVSKIYQFLVRR